MKTRTSGSEQWKLSHRLSAPTAAQRGHLENRHCETHGFTPHRHKRKLVDGDWKWCGWDCMACQRDRNTDTAAIASGQERRRAIEEHQEAMREREADYLRGWL